MKDKAVLEMKNIHKSFPGVHALQGVDFTLCEGEIHALMGENGAGKSTLIKVLTGVYNKEDGSLNVNPNSLTVTSAYVEPELLKAKGYDSYQFVRNGFFCADIHDSKEGAPVFNRIVSLKSSFKLPKA